MFMYVFALGKHFSSLFDVRINASVSISFVRGRGLGDGRTIPNFRESPTICILATAGARCCYPRAAIARYSHVSVFGGLDTAFSPVVAAVVVSVCRVMLSIRSVAATGHVDPEWLLNHAELSRVHWRRGTVDGEIIVEASELPISLDTKFPNSTQVLRGE